MPSPYLPALRVVPCWILLDTDYKTALFAWPRHHHHHHQRALQLIACPGLVASCHSNCWGGGGVWGGCGAGARRGGAQCPWSWHLTSIITITVQQTADSRHGAPDQIYYYFIPKIEHQCLPTPLHFQTLFQKVNTKMRRSDVMWVLLQANKQLF